MSKKKPKLVKVDDYFNNGIYEIARFGKHISMRNILSDDDRVQMHNCYAENYLNKKNEIDALVQIIKEKISLCSPLDLLNFSNSMNFIIHINRLSEFEYSSEENAIGRATEYIQSVLVSSENNYIPSSEDPSTIFNEILAEIEKLYSKLVYFYHYWSADLIQTNPNIDRQLLTFIVESQMLFLVRGDRYQFLELEYLRNLLPPHNNILMNLFDMNAEDIINGLEKLQYSLSQGKADAVNNMIDEYDTFINMIESGGDEQEYIKQSHEQVSPIIERMLGTALNDVIAVTDWKKKLVDALTLELNKDMAFFTNENFAGWPVLDLPVHKKPFIKIDNTSYCFDYYGLFDNIYRILQKAIKELKPEYSDTWAQLQQVASETMVENILKRILPGCSTYRDNYYPKNKSLKECAENDIIVLYDNTLLIVEVKAGSYTYTPPILDYPSHIKSLKTLVEKADHQCDRILSYMKSEDEVTIYDREKKPKTNIKLSDYKYIYTFSITVDNFNESAAKAEKLSFLNLKNNSISLSTDDLMLYAEYFESPLYFLHFLKQRKLATLTPNIAVNDELDHLGMYINNNMYSLQANDFGEGANILWFGFREELDKYFCCLYHPSLKLEKPKQDIPKMINKIVDFLDVNKKANRSYLSNFLLDMSTDSRKEFSEFLNKALIRQKETGHMSPIISFGEVRYCVFMHQPSIKQLCCNEKSDYIYSTILTNDEKDRLWINLFFDSNDNLEDINFYICKYEDVSSERERLLELGKHYAESRINSYLRQTGRKKIEPNETCPCGSGKKYKKCCKE